MRTIFRKYVSLLRPHQWMKNLLLLFPPFFGGKILHPDVLPALLPSFLSFSFVASCCYIINDMKDRAVDRNHSVKKNRAIASGDISLMPASIIALALYLAGMLIAGSVSVRFEGYLMIYIFLSFLYTMYFKNIVILDIFFIAFGFLIRVKAGGEAFHVDVTNWLFLTVFIVAIFLSTGKRLGELISEGANAPKHRVSLNRYSASFLEGMFWFSASSALVTYALYILENRSSMIYTVPVAAFGLLRYILIVKEGKGDPTEALLRDGQITVTGIIWVSMIGIIIY